MKVQLHPSQLLSLVTQLNLEIQDQIIAILNESIGPAYVASWSMENGEDRMEICCDTKMVEVRSIVIPVDVIDSMSHAIPLSGARVEVVGAWRIDSDHLWLRNHSFGEAGTLVLALPSFEPDHIKAAASTLAEQIVAYLDNQLETC